MITYNSAKKRRGFIAMTTALVVAVFLFLISAGITTYAYQALRTEAWMTDRAQRSLYPIAWSTAYFVLDEISRDIDATVPLTRRVPTTTAATTFVSGGFLDSRDISFRVSFDNQASVDVRIVLSSDLDYRAMVTASSPINVTVIATDGASGLKSIVAGQLVSVDIGTNPKGIGLDWKGE